MADPVVVPLFLQGGPVALTIAIFGAGGYYYRLLERQRRTANAFAVDIDIRLRQLVRLERDNWLGKLKEAIGQGLCPNAVIDEESDRAIEHYWEDLSYLPEMAVSRIVKFYRFEKYFSTVLAEINSERFRDPAMTPARRLHLVEGIEQLVLPDYKSTARQALLAVRLVQRLSILERFSFANRRHHWLGWHRKTLSKMVKSVRNASR